MPRNPKVASVIILTSALAWDEVTYSSAPLFTLHSLDGKPLAPSAKIRVLYGFGEARLKLRPLTHTVEKETVLSHAP